MEGILKEAKGSHETLALVYQTCSDLLPPFVLPTEILTQTILSPVSLGWLQGFPPQVVLAYVSDIFSLAYCDSTLRWSPRFPPPGAPTSVISYP